jgi:hypothetical protein
VVNEPALPGRCITATASPMLVAQLVNGGKPNPPLSWPVAWALGLTASIKVASSPTTSTRVHADLDSPHSPRSGAPFLVPTPRKLVIKS